MKKFICILLFFVLHVSSYADGEKILDSANALQSLVQKRQISSQLAQNSVAVAVFSNVHQAGFFLGGLVGNGVIVKRNEFGWSEPIGIEIKGGSLGIQFGYQNSDLIFFILNSKIANDMYNQKITLGVDASITAWNMGGAYVGQTDVKLTSDIYVLASNKGLFAGVSFGGAVLKLDNTPLSSTPYAIERWRGVLNMLERR